MCAKQITSTVKSYEASNCLTICLVVSLLCSWKKCLTSWACGCKQHKVFMWLQIAHSLFSLTCAGGINLEISDSFLCLWAGTICQWVLLQCIMVFSLSLGYAPSISLLYSNFSVCVCETSYEYHCLYIILLPNIFIIIFFYFYFYFFLVLFLCVCIMIKLLPYQLLFFPPALCVLLMDVI